MCRLVAELFNCYDYFLETFRIYLAKYFWWLLNSLNLIFQLLYCTSITPLWMNFSGEFDKMWSISVLVYSVVFVGFIINLWSEKRRDLNVFLTTRGAWLKESEYYFFHSLLFPLKRLALKSPIWQHFWILEISISFIEFLRYSINLGLPGFPFNTSTKISLGLGKKVL